MYPWKVWRDSRSRIAIYTLAALSTGILFGLQALASDASYRAYVLTYPRYRAYFSPGYQELSFVPRFSNYVLVYGQYFALLSALILGAASVGKEYAAGTMNFLLTRPCPRRNFVLTDWKISISALIVIIGALGFGIYPFFVFARAAGPGNVLALLPGLWAVAIALFGLSHFTTALAGSTARGIILAAGAAVAYTQLPIALKLWWHSDWAYDATEWTFRMFEWSWGPPRIDWPPTIFWLVVAAGFLAGSAAVLRYREV